MSEPHPYDSKSWSRFDDITTPYEIYEVEIDDNPSRCLAIRKDIDVQIDYVRFMKPPNIGSMKEQP